MKRVYVMGLYSKTADGEFANVIDLAVNMTLGMKVCAELFRKGYAPFAPWLDFTYCRRHCRCNSSNLVFPR